MLPSNDHEIMLITCILTDVIMVIIVIINISGSKARRT